MVIPWAKAAFDKAYKRRKRLFDYFRSLGASTANFAEYSDSFEEITCKVEISDLIYLRGGLTSALVKRPKNKSVGRLLRKYDGVGVGRSSDTIALGKKCIVTKNRRDPTFMIINGIGLVDFSVQVQYRSSKDGELIRLSKEEKICAISERSPLVYDNCHLSFMGNVYVFQNGEKTHAD